MKKIAFVFVLLLCAVVPSQSSFAHVLITDDTNSQGAILHIIPDDDPIAGQVSTLYFDAQKQLINENDSITLTIYDEVGGVYNVPTNRSKSLLTADFKFPNLGVYEITFVIYSEGETRTFRQSQRVSRGVANSMKSIQNYAWGEMMLIGSGIAFALLLVVGFNNRKDIIKHSKIG